MGSFTEKIREVLSSILPVTIFVLILHVSTLTRLSGMEIGQFLMGALLVLVGLAVFLVGVDLGATPIGEYSGRYLVSKGKMSLLLLGGLLLGFLISIAEPDLQILATQVQQLTGAAITKWTMVIVVSIGVGLLVMIGFWRIARQVRLRYVVWGAYGVILLLAIFNRPIFHDFAFDASGSTTGAITTPFVLALAAGVAHLSTTQQEDARDQFGLVGLASAGAILAVLAQGLFLRSVEFTPPPGGGWATPSTFFEPFRTATGPSFFDSLLCVAPLLIVFLLLHTRAIKLRSREVIRIYVGLIFCYLGLSVFMIGVMGGFMSTGHLIGTMLVARGKPYLTIIAGFFLGMFTVVAEPAVHVLTRSIEDETDGVIPRKVVLAFLSIGVAISVALAAGRIYIEGLHLWHILLPGYILIMIMSYFTPDLFLGIAFDAGGVASGPMTATFILAFTQGIAEGVPIADVLLDGFGVIALVAMAPLITLQLLGLISMWRTKQHERELEEKERDEALVAPSSTEEDTPHVES
ncbi:MAG: DUF1538 domain-containing protein [Saccharofermentanales bacterium]|jgi:hypothetical protein